MMKCRAEACKGRDQSTRECTRYSDEELNVGACGVFVRLTLEELHGQRKDLTDTQRLIVEECEAIKEKLLEKNRKYGDSAIHPMRVFSKASADEQINVRLDDKLSRIISNQDDDEEEPEFDIIGYLVLKRVWRKANETES